jgi:uncharacterized protein YegL
MEKREMSQEKTVVAIVLDKSGSMAGTAAQTVIGYNEYVQQIKQNANKGVQTEVCLLTFNGEVFEHLWLEPAEKLEEASVESYQPTGSTALYDALNYTINKLGKTGYDDNTTSYLLIVISDGEENASTHTELPALKEHIESLESKDNWTITYMGCSKQVLEKVARATGIKTQNMAAWSNASAAHANYAYVNSAQHVNKYMSSRSAGMKKMEAFYNDGGPADFTELSGSGVADAVDLQTSALNFISPAVCGMSAAQPAVAKMKCCTTGGADVFASGGPVNWVQ